MYFGAEDIEQFTPGEHSVIRTAEFASPKQLAAHLLYLDRNSTAYREYFAWKDRPLRRGWREHRRQCAFFAQEQICDAALKLQEAERAEIAI